MRGWARVAAIGAWLLAGVVPALAEPVRNRFFTNDALGDGHDRWHSGSYNLFWSWERAPAALAAPWLSDQALDLHLRAEILSPWDGGPQDRERDRPYAGLLAFGATRVETRGATQLSFGGELVVLGKQTGLARFQANIHNHFGLSGYDPYADARRAIGNALNGALFMEAAHNIDRGVGGWRLRPFVALHAGYENHARLGVDLLVGANAGAARYVRDATTGFLKPSDAGGAREGLSLVAGADVTAVAQSDLFPDWAAAEIKSLRTRARLGAQITRARFGAFYGLTYLGREFETQAEGQLLGTLSFDLRF